MTAHCGLVIAFTVESGVSMKQPITYYVLVYSDYLLHIPNETYKFHCNKFQIGLNRSRETKYFSCPYDLGDFEKHMEELQLALGVMNPSTD
jgi:hypothetical protein